MPQNSLLRSFLFLLLALPIGFMLLYPEPIHCMRISQSPDFSQISGLNEVYSSRKATTSQQKLFRQNSLIARNRIRRFWGGQRGRAVLIYCPVQADYEQYCAGGEGAGCSVGMPWGQSYVVSGPDGNNVDVIAHELCHDELFTRLGWWRVKREIPQWFNEGLALLVDYRFSNPSVWEHPDSSAATSLFADEPIRTNHSRQPMLKLTDLETTRDFFGGDYTHTMLAYQTAAEEVARWLTVVGRAGVPALAAAVANGSEFGETYRQLERKKRKR